jgi:periplasmic divalent cation tolerance protein
MDHAIVYVTASDQAEARRIGTTVVSERLAACANLLGPIESVYWWEGRVQTGAEVALILKTRSSLVDELIRRVKELHSYQCPAILSCPILGGNVDFLRWITDETSPGLQQSGAR